MNKKVALITGCNGQDGSYLSEYLLQKDYAVRGIVRRHSVAENQTTRIQDLRNAGERGEVDFEVVYGDVTDAGRMTEIVRRFDPDEIYSLAAQSHVSVSFEIPHYTLNTNILGTFNTLEAARIHGKPEIKFYQASSSEMFGNEVSPNGKFQDEDTRMNPVSPYGVSKTACYNLVRNYRRAYKMFATNGILFNHESPRRGVNFVTNKVAKAAAEIAMGIRKGVKLGNLNSERDWGHAKDYVVAMHKMLQHDIPDDFVIATGVTHSVGELCEAAFSMVGISDWENYVETDQRYLRAEDLTYLCGNSAKAKRELNWEATITFDELISEMVEYWMTE